MGRARSYACAAVLQFERLGNPPREPAWHAHTMRVAAYALMRSTMESMSFTEVSPSDSAVKFGSTR